jgi:hypothetical protein
MATTSSRIAIVDITNLAVADAAVAINASIETLEGAGFVVLDQEVRFQNAAGQPKVLVYLRGQLASLQSASYEVTESMFVGLGAFTMIGGTWTQPLGTTLTTQPVLHRAAADATGTGTFCFGLPVQSVAGRGAKLLSVDLVYDITTAALDAFSALTISSKTKVASPVATGAAPVLATLASTMDTAHDAAGERVTTGTHMARAVIDSPAYLATGRDGYQVDFTFDAAATSILEIAGAWVNYKRWT